MNGNKKFVRITALVLAVIMFLSVFGGVIFTTMGR